jgi:hypothetical protein
MCSAEEKFIRVFNCVSECVNNDTIRSKPADPLQEPQAFGHSMSVPHNIHTYHGFSIKIKPFTGTDTVQVLF